MPELFKYVLFIVFSCILTRIKITGNQEENSTAYIQTTDVLKLIFVI